jgi:hypothetical protein
LSIAEVAHHKYINTFKIAYGEPIPPKSRLFRVQNPGPISGWPNTGKG